MKKTVKFLSVCMSLALCASGLAACGPKVTEEVDAKRTQLYVANYSGGAGTEWLEDVKVRFEAKYADTSFEEGKTGVQLMLDHDKNYAWTSMKDIISTDKNHIYFTQDVDYYNAASDGLFYDLTELIEEVNENDHKTIKSKLYDYQLNNLAIDGKYYALPHYELYQGVSYDAGVFAEKNLYFADTIDSADTTYPGTRTFVVNKTTKKSCGPDGKYGTYDDGLPSSYQEFYKLMDKMTKNNVTPFVWTGKHTHYTQQLICSLYANYARANGVNLNFTYDSLGQEFEYVESFTDSTPNISKAVITKDNAYLTKQSAGLYYALEFAEKVFNNEKNYYVPCISNTFSHLNAMEEFMYSGLEGTEEDYIGMLIDGNYWYNEATEDGIFTRLKEDLPLNYTKKDVKFMPLPVQYAGTVTENNGHAPTLVDSYNSFAFVNANIDDSLVDLAKTFLSFCYSDEELKTYTVNTRGIVKAVNYDVTSVLDSLPSFSRSVIEMRDASVKESELVYGYSNNPVFIKNSSNFYLNSHKDFWSTTTKNGSYSFAYYAFTAGRSVKDVFEGMWISESVWKNSYLK